MVQTKFSGTIKGESAMVNTSDIGSLVEFTFKVSHFFHSDYIRPPGFEDSLPTFPHLHPVFGMFIRLHMKEPWGGCFFDVTVKSLYLDHVFI